MKKIISTMVAISMLFTMSLGVFALPYTGAIANITTTNFTNLADEIQVVYNNSDNDYEISNISDLVGATVRPNDEIKIMLTGSMFTDSSGNPLTSDSVSRKSIDAAKITVVASTTSNSKCADVTLGGKNGEAAYISIKFYGQPQYFESKFSYSIFLQKYGTRKTNTRIPLSGKIVPQVKKISSSTNFVDLSGSIYAVPTGFIRSCEAYIGSECSVVKPMKSGEKHAGVAYDEVLTEDEKLFLKYSSLDKVVRLQTINLKANSKVNFDYGTEYYVYNSSGKFIQKGTRALPFYTKYYFSTKKYDAIV